MLAGPMAETVCSTVLRRNYPQPLQPRPERFPIGRRVHTQDYMTALQLDIREGRKSEQGGAANTYRLSLGLLTHPDRQPSGVADRGRSLE